MCTSINKRNNKASYAVWARKYRQKKSVSHFLESPN